MYRFLLTPRWIGFHLLVIVGMVVMINLGFWQLDRLDQRQAFNATIEARYDAAPVPLDELLEEAGDDLDSVEWRPVTVVGSFGGGDEVHVVNRSQHGRPGYNVMTPFDLGEGRALLVNRGFVPLGAPDGDIAAPPDGEMTLAGRIHPSDERQRGQLSDPSEGHLDEVQRVDIDRLDQQVDGALLPVYLELVEPRADGYPEAVAQPELSEGSHLSYAVQWFVFAACVATGWVLAVRMSIRRRHPAITQRDADGSDSEPEAVGV